MALAEGSETMTSHAANNSITTRSLLPFFLFTFLLTWGVIGLYVFLNEPMTRIFGQLTGTHPLFYLAVWSPGIVAFIIIFINAGRAGLQTFLRGMLRWKANWGWYLFLLVGIPVIFVGGSWLNGNLLNEPLPYQAFAPAITAIFLGLIKGPVEEFGWRGLALPLLQKKMAPIWAALFIGVIWGLWHTPAFLLSGTQQSQWDFAPFFLGCVAISVIATPLFNSTRGSLLLSAFFHFNLMNPLWPDAQPYDTWLLAAVAVVLVWIYRKSMFSPAGGIKDVIIKD